MLSSLGIGHVHALTVDEVISASYASHLSVKTTQSTSLYSHPTTASGSSAKYTLSAGTMLSVKELHKNTSGEYWYEVLYYNMTLYVKAADTTLVDHLTGDIVATDIESPTNLAINEGFPIKGTITTTINDLGKIEASMHSGSNITTAPVLTSSDTITGKAYTLYNSTVDKNLIFSDLAAGVYTYVLTAEAVSYYIDDNDAFATSKKTVVLDTTMCPVINSSSPLPSLHEGIDVSVWNGDIDWAKVATQTEFAILRASWEETADEKFHVNAQGCTDNNIPFGVYVYSYAETVSEAIGEAEYVLSLVDGYDLTLPIYFDWEDEVCVGLDYSLQASIVRAFCDTILEAGYQPGLYSYTWLVPSAFSDSYFNSIPLWVAHYGVSYHGYNGGVHMWQHSCEGTIDGISGNVDMNHMYVELPDTGSSDTSYRSRCTYYPSNAIITSNVSTSIYQYPASDYTILSTISAGTDLRVTGLYKNAYGNLWYEIIQNGVTGYVYAESFDVKEFLYDDVAVIDPAMATNLTSGNGYYISGELVSKYNELATVHTRVYSGEDTLADPVLKSSYSPSSKYYDLYKSEVDTGLWFGTQSTGYYTYEISADITSYYYGDGGLQSTTENVVLWTAPYTVNNATITPPASGTVCTHNTTTLPAVAPTCTETGLTEGSYCSKCGEVFSEQTVVPATGHSYSSKVIPANCKEYEQTQYTCTLCGDSYKQSVQTHSEWSETKPEGIEESLIETKTQYRYSDYSTITSPEPSVDGYTLINSEWIKNSDGTVYYVPSWPSGFDKTSSIYNEYNGTKKTASQNYYTKTVIDSDAVCGYLYYHWCAPNSYYSYASSTGSYTTFHAYYATANPSTYECDTSDMSYKTSNTACCTNSNWYFVATVYAQKYSTYTAQYTHSIWSEFSEWSDTPATAAWNKQVETRTLYRYQMAQLGDHVFVNGTCSVCGETCEHSFTDSKCTICGFECTTHNFQNGKCTVCSLTCKPHSFTNGVCTICGTVCTHTSWHNSKCDTCGTTCSHNSFTDGKCDTCGMVCDHNFTNSICSVCGAHCSHPAYTNGKCDTCGTACTHNSWTDSRCDTCSKICSHVNWVQGECSVCQKVCAHPSYTDSKCDVCKLICTHPSYTNSKCDTCKTVCTHPEWTDGQCDTCHTVCGHNTWTEGKCDTCQTVCTHPAWTDGQCNTCHTICNHDSYTNGKCDTCETICQHNWVEGSCIVCGTDCDHTSWTDDKCDVCHTSCDHNWSNSSCTVCGKVCSEHHYIDNICSVCNKVKPDYYLFGYIDGVDYGCGADSDNIGEYKFIDGKLTVTFTQNSYVAVKTSDNLNLYMTNGYQGDNMSLAILYNSTLLGSNADKLFVPKGREVTFTLTENADGTLILSYTAAACKHSLHGTNGICTACGAVVKHTYSNGSCTICGLSCQHDYTNGICTICKYRCTHSFSDDTCTICGIVCTHKAWTDGKCDTCQTECDHTSYANGKCGTCQLPCSHPSYTEGKCDKCSSLCEHNFSQGVCSDCSLHSFYLIGTINGTDIGYNGDYKNIGPYGFNNGSVTLAFTEDSKVFVKNTDSSAWYMASEKSTGQTATLYNISSADAEEMLLVPAGTQVTFTLAENTDGTLTLTYVIDSCSHKLHTTNGICVACKETVSHSYIDGVCSICADTQVKDMYLFGEINGTDYAYNADADNLGEYKFNDGTLTVIFTKDSYVGIKTSDNLNWYMTDGNLGKVTSATLYNTAVHDISAQLLFIPGNTEVTLTLVTNSDGTINISYTTKELPAPAPVLKPQYTVLNCENELRYDVYFTVSNLGSLSCEDMGLIILNEGDTLGTIDTAKEVISGVTAEGKYFYASTGSIHPMYMGDNVYYKLYIKQPDGSYIYSNLMSYNAVTYANSVLTSKHSTDAEKALMLALLNYGAEAQLYYGYKTDSLVNSHLTMGQMSKLEDYRADMAQGVTNLDSTKTGDFTKTATGTILYPTADFSHDLFTLNINCMTAKKIDGDITLYYWDEETVSGVDELTAENASGVLTMVRNDNGTYTAQIDGISAKDMSDTIYVSAVYSSNGAACCTGVTAYSVAELCKLHAEKDSSSMQDLAQAAIVFGYYANACFNN